MRRGLKNVQKGPGADLAPKLPICVRHSIRNGSLLGRRQNRAQEEVQEGVRERPGKASKKRSKTRSERRTRKKLREDDHQKCLDVKTQIGNPEADQTKTTPRTPRASSPNVSRGWSYNLKSASATNDDQLIARVDQKCDQRKNMKLHHPIIPDRQGPTDGLSPNRHGHRSRSHSAKSDNNDDNDPLLVSRG